MASARTYGHDYRERHVQWKAKLMADPDKTPYEDQWIILNLVHARCEKEHEVEAGDDRTAQLQDEVRLTNARK